MRSLNLKPEHKAVTDYYAEIEKLGGFGQVKEGSVAPAFSKLLSHCARQFDYTLIEQYTDKVGGHNLRYDGLLVDEFKLHHGIWEAKDTNDKLDTEIKKKFEKGYPNKNIMFQDPKRIVVYQNGKEVFGEDVTKPEKLIEALKIFFDYEQPIIEDFHKAVEQFKQEIPKLAEGLQAIIDEEQARNIAYQKSFADFTKLCQKSINPNIAEAALEEMLIQHLLTERLFRTVFKNPDFVKRNAIAVEIEKVIDAMTSRAFDRSKFTEKLDRFYRAIEEAAKDITDWNEMQAFMNTVYEKFFQGFAIKVADTHGIVYTPQPIVNFMVRSVEDILQREFGRSLSDPGVHILDPFVGTGNFIVNIMKAIRQTALPNKYASELHCNEVMLLPYYVACMNIEHEYYEKTGEYKPFEGICFVDTFQLAEPEGNYLFSMTEKNTERVEYTAPH
jgi:hypothetical protein